MAKNWFLTKFEIKRNAIRKDIFYFFIPWITVMVIELQFIGRDGLSGILGIIWGLIKQPQNLVMFPVQGIIGLALILVGFTIMLVGHATLWRNYSSLVVIHKDHKLITHGIYRFTRNPIYLGFFMVFFGLPVYSNSLYGFLTMLFFIPIFLNRIRLEEKLLTEEFQDAFKRYKETTKKLIPFIY
jgi:protein-S-isoprenylcysteine O-methyltransferase Ste14